MTILQTIQAAQIPADEKKAILLTFASLRRLVAVSFEAFFTAVTTHLRPDLGALMQATRDLRLTDDQQVGLLAIYLDGLEKGGKHELGSFLIDLVESVQVADAKTDTRQKTRVKRGYFTRRPGPISAPPFAPPASNCGLGVAPALAFDTTQSPPVPVAGQQPAWANPWAQLRAANRPG